MLHADDEMWETERKWACVGRGRAGQAFLENPWHSGSPEGANEFVCWSKS